MSDRLMPTTETSSGLPSGPVRSTFACPGPVMWTRTGSWSAETKAVGAVNDDHGATITLADGFSKP